MSSNDQTDKIEKSNNKSKKIVILCVAVIVVLLTVIAILMLRKKEEKEEPKRNVVVTKDNVDEVIEVMTDEEYVEPGYYSVSMNTTWHFASGDAVSEDAYVENVSENTHDVYFDVFLADDEDEAILKSPVIPRGSELNNITLDKSLSAGTYECVMIYHLVDEEQDTISTLRVGFIIIVEG